MAKESPDKFTFNVSLSVLDHLGRNLYRSFVTVLGEAISNSWDAGAENVWIEIDREAGTLLVKDDGQGMTKDDFQNKFLRIGYSKRLDDSVRAWNNRPFIGRKGIGKLALLSCAQKISVASKTTTTGYVGGVIDNAGLSAAISHDLTPDQYPLLDVDPSVFGNHLKNHLHGTLIHFDGIKEGIRNTVDFIKKTVALYFRFSLLDDSFRIHVNGDEIGINSLSDLQESTEFLWLLNNPVDPYVQNLVESLGDALKEKEVINVPLKLNGFIASVRKPRDLTIMGMGERVTVDLYVNGRVRERDIIKHIPTSRVTENYLYGQIHYNDMDDDVDRFT
ncbi:MAG: DNA mismatch repair protein, partial [Flavobacteriales bacterium]|nr:DNA mismatch repair protein [Flavobacteriales bacterium]